MTDRLILTDIDGCVLDWCAGFDDFMIRHGYTKHHSNEYKLSDCYGIPKEESSKMVRIFNDSAVMGFLPPYRDAVHYIRKLHAEHGYVFHAITSMSKEYASQELRTQNLRNLFGRGPFTRFVYLDTGADKDEAYGEYKGADHWLIEDKPENAILALELGLRPIFMDSSYTMNVTLPKEVIRVRDWKTIYQIVTGS